jgi:hypothetical protein
LQLLGPFSRFSGGHNLCVGTAIDEFGDGFSALKYPSTTSQRTMATVCKHPKVRVVSRHDDAEFVECLECGEVFDSEEFRDMEIEETVGTEKEEIPEDS